MATLLTQIHEYLDELIIIDGAWRPFLALGYYSSAESTDDTRQIVESLDLKCPWKWVSPPETGWESHAAKCAEFLKYLKLGDWQYYLNDDEIPFGNIGEAFKEIRGEKDAFKINVPFYETFYSGKRAVKALPRFFKWRRGIHYGYTHADLEDGEGVNFRAWPAVRASKMHIVHMKQFRPAHMRERTSKKFNRFTDVHVRGSEETLRELLASPLKKTSKMRLGMPTSEVYRPTSPTVATGFTGMRNVTIVIPTYNQKNALIETLRNLQPQLGSGDEIIVVDDGSIDGTQEAVEGFSHVQVIRQERKGLVSALNVGMMAVKTSHNCANVVLARPGEKVDVKHLMSGIWK